MFLLISALGTFCSSTLRIPAIFGTASRTEAPTGPSSEAISAEAVDGSVLAASPAARFTASRLVGAIACATVCSCARSTALRRASASAARRRFRAAAREEAVADPLPWCAGRSPR